VSTMRHDPREVREGLKEVLAGDTPPATRRAVRDAIELIATMLADLRRQGLTEYQTGDTDD
jgi:hypothetical protein